MRLFTIMLAGILMTGYASAQVSGSQSMPGTDTGTPDIADALPEELDGWTAEPLERFDRSNLYRYINGGAELFLAYDFEEAVAVRYVHVEQPEILVDIFRMGSAADAFGVFSMSRERESSAVGQGSQRGSGLLLFWMHRYYVSILASPETDASAEATTKLAKRIEEAIGRTGATPGLLAKLPRKGLLKTSVRFFHHHALQTIDGFPVADNVLDLHPGTDVVSARYRIEGDDAGLFLIRYTDDTAAERAFATWMDFCRESRSESGERYCGGFRVGSICAVTYGCEKETTSVRLLDAARTNLQ